MRKWMRERGRKFTPPSMIQRQHATPAPAGARLLICWTSTEMVGFGVWDDRSGRGDARLGQRLCCQSGSGGGSGQRKDASRDPRHAGRGRNPRQSRFARRPLRCALAGFGTPARGVLSQRRHGSRAIRQSHHGRNGQGFGAGCPSRVPLRNPTKELGIPMDIGRSPGQSMMIYLGLGRGRELGL